MKTQIKRFSKSALAVVLTLCMLVSCMTVGIIATDAAKVSDSGAIAAKVDDETAGAAKEITLYAWIIKNLYDYYSGGINVWGGTSEGVKSTTKVGTTTTVSGTTYYLVKATVYNDNNMVNFKGNDNWWVNSAGTSIDLSTNNCIRINGDGADSTITALQYAATPTSADATISGVSGNGTQSNPYKLTVGTTYTVNISGVQSDSNMTGFLYNTANNATGRNTTSTRTLSSNTVSTGNSSTYYVWSYKGTTSTVSSESKSKTIYYDWVSSTTPLAKPSPSWDNATVTASPTGKATLSWAAVSNASSYKIFKGTSTTAEATVNTTSYQVDKKYSKRGDYYVVAVPSNTTSYSESEKSNKATLTVNRTKLTAPTVTVSKTDIKNGDSVTLTATDQNSGASTDQYSLYYYITTLNAIDTFKLTSGTAKTLSPTTNTTYKVVAYPVSGTSNEYYTQSDATSATQIKVYSPEYKIAGEEGLIGSTAWSYAAAKDFTDYTSNGIFTFTTQAVSAGDHYFKLYDSSHGYSGSGTQNINTNVTIGDSNKYSITLNDSEASFKVSGSGIFVIYYDSVNKKIWVTQNTWAVSTVARVKTYNLSTGAYNAVANATSTHGTASPASINVEKGQSTTLTATAKTGYSFVGWYTNEACTTAASGSYTSTSYSATPTANTTYYALFKQTEPQKVDISVANITGATITAKWNNQTKTNGESLTSVPVGASVTVTVTPNDNKYLISTTPSLSSSKFTVSTSTTNITATLGDKLSVTAKTNKSDRGTVSVSSSYVKPGDAVTVTVSPKNGVLKTLTYTYGTTTKSLYPTTNSSLNATKLDVATVTAMMYDFFNKSGEALGATVNDEAVGADSTYTFEMPESAVTVNATFDAYSGESTWYYNGYDTSGNAVSGYHGKQMTEAMVGGEKFSYYEVSGRTGTDQLMTVSNGAASSGTRYVYFTASAEAGWSTNENHQYAYFYNNSGDAGNAWPGYKMTKYTTNDYGQNVYRVEIPTSSSPTGVVFNNSTYSPHKTTNVTDLSKGGYYLLSTHHNDGGTEIHDWQSYDCTYPGAGYSTGTEYFYGSDNDQSTIYSTDNNGKSIFNTTGFYHHGTNNKNYAKPRLTDSDKGDYYVNVLYPGKTYTINGVTKTIGTDPVVIWTKEPLAGDDETVKVYAKDGAIRAETFGSTYANIADTKIYAADGTTTVGTKQSGSITNQTYETYKAAKGDTIVIKTTIGATDSSTLSNAADLKAKYYVRGFCVNGEVSQLLDPNDTGVYTLTYKVPEDYEGKNIEITPIYYLKNTTANPIVTYRVTGFTDELKAVGSGKPGWGDTLYTYPFYGNLGGQNNAFGAYPGQPMVYYKGQYQMQIPQKSTAWDIYYADSALSGYTGDTAKANAVANTPVSGVTMSNGYWDSVHKTIMGYGDNSSSADHVQTYDYGDFYKIFNEKKPVDNIVFDFKYRTKKHNFENQPAASTTKSALDTDYGTNGNGFELLTNFHGRTVDLFGTPLSGEQLNATPVYVVSIGGVDETNKKGVENIAGYYATEWMVYGSSNGTDYNRITDGKANGKSSIPPEVLVLNDDDTTSFNTTTYPSADAGHQLTDWKDLYTALEAYRGKPVMISYEAADAQQGQGMYYTGTGGATRNDGRWLYSKNGENITSKIRVDVSHDSGATYVTNPAEGVTGHVDGLSAYFTNADAYQKTTYATTIDPDKTFDFEAKTTNASYKFVGWFMEDGTKITSDNASHTERSGSYTFVARFMEVSSGQLVLSHSVGTGAEVSIGGNDYTCDGSGSAYIGAVITDAETGEVLKTYDVANKDITIDEKYIGSDKNYNITVTLIAQADTNTAQGTTKLTNTSDTVTESEFFNPNTGTDSGKQRTFTFTFNVKNNLYSGTAQKTMSLIYNSYFIQYKFIYQINYTFKDRTGETKQYKRIGTLTPAEANTYVKKVGSSRYLDKSFIEKMAPVESNFGQNISWTFGDYLISTGGEDGSNYEYNIDAHYTATQTEIAKRNVTFVLPYAHDEYGVATLDGEGKGTKATSANLEFVDKSKSGGSDERVTFAQIPVLKDNKTNGIYTEEEKSHWIAAPQTIMDGNNELTFQYWSIKTTDHCTAQDPDVSRCYFPGFNFIAYDNYVIEAIYGDTSVLPSEYGKNTNITYVETTRNQWNTNGTDYLKTQRDKAADLLYNDFIVSYSLDGKEIYSGEADNDIADIGIVVERIRTLDTKQDGSLDTTLSKYTDIAERADDVDSVINGGTVTGFSKHSITKNSNGKGYKLDNKDRYNIYDAFYNSAGWNQTTTGGNPAANYTYKNYVYRAYSYMKLTNGTIVKSSPAYFTMYDVATANYSSN